MIVLKRAASVGAIAAIAVAACGIEPLDYSTKTCPCPAHLFCDQTTNRCVDKPPAAATCIPKSCVDLGVECGKTNDGCDQIVDCGACSPTYMIRLLEEPTGRVRGEIWMESLRWVDTFELGLRRQIGCGAPRIVRDSADMPLEPEERATLVAREEDDGLRFDIVLQGAGETTFFAV